MLSFPTVSVGYVNHRWRPEVMAQPGGGATMRQHSISSKPALLETMQKERDAAQSNASSSEAAAAKERSARLRSDARVRDLEHELSEMKSELAQLETKNKVLEKNLLRAMQHDSQQENGRPGKLGEETAARLRAETQVGKLDAMLSGAQKIAAESTGRYNDLQEVLRSTLERCETLEKERKQSAALQEQTQQQLEAQQSCINELRATEATLRRKIEDERHERGVVEGKLSAASLHLATVHEQSLSTSERVGQLEAELEEALRVKNTVQPCTAEVASGRCSGCAEWEARAKEAEGEAADGRTEVGAMSRELEAVRGELKRVHSEAYGRLEQHRQILLDVRALDERNAQLSRLLDTATAELADTEKKSEAKIRELEEAERRRSAEVDAQVQSLVAKVEEQQRRVLAADAATAATFHQRVMQLEQEVANERSKMLHAQEQRALQSVRRLSEVIQARLHYERHGGAQDGAALADDVMPGSAAGDRALPPSSLPSEAACGGRERPVPIDLDADNRSMLTPGLTPVGGAQTPTEGQDMEIPPGVSVWSSPVRNQQCREDMGGAAAASRETEKGRSITSLVPSMWRHTPHLVDAWTGRMHAEGVPPVYPYHHPRPSSTTLLGTTAPAPRAEQRRGQDKPHVAERLTQIFTC